jgi:hypothetical protein
LAIKELGYNEILLIAGKGHEQYQDFGLKKIHFSDESEIKKFFIIKKNKLLILFGIRVSHLRCFQITIVLVLIMFP